MRVLHVYKIYFPENVTGIPRVIHELCEQRLDPAVAASVLALSENPSQTPIEVGCHEVYQVRQDLIVASTGMSFGIFAKFAALAEKADIIHYHYPWPMADLLYFWAGSNRPSIVTYHSDIVKQKLILPLYSGLMHAFLSRVDAIVATSPNYVQTSSVLTRYRERVQVIPIGIAERQVPASALVAKWRERVGGDFFLFVGAFRYYKGLPFLLEAAKATGLRVVIAGAGDPGQLGLDTVPGNTIFLGEVTDADKEALLSLCRAFVLPSHLRSEAFGIALLEASRAGKPMLSCEIGTGTSYVNVHEVTGLTVPPADPGALAAAMMRLESDPNLASRLGHAARLRFEENFTAAQMASDYLDLYRSLLRSHGR